MKAQQLRDLSAMLGLLADLMAMAEAVPGIDDPRLLHSEYRFIDLQRTLADLLIEQRDASVTEDNQVQAVLCDHRELLRGHSEILEKLVDRLKGATLEKTPGDSIGPTLFEKGLGPDDAR